jgi:signal peptidase I
MDVFWDNVKTILYALALAMVLRFTIAQPFRIPSGSMQPTLEVGDYIVVTKWSYGYGRFSFAPLEGLLPHGRLFGSSRSAATSSCSARAGAGPRLHQAR